MLIRDAFELLSVICLCLGSWKFALYLFHRENCNEMFHSKIICLIIVVGISAISIVSFLFSIHFINEMINQYC